MHIVRNMIFLIIPLEILFPVVVPRGSFPRYPGLSHHACAIVRVCPVCILHLALLYQAERLRVGALGQTLRYFVEIFMILLEISIT